MLVRAMKLPDRSFFLFGPRGTGKTTWLSQVIPDALRFDLLDAATYGDLSLQPQRFIQRIRAEKPAWVIVDEVQKLPGLLDSVHQSISESPRTRFALTGSSARKLRRGGANLLAGRAVTREFHPLTANELGEHYALKHSLTFGQLPSVYFEKSPADYLLAYVGTYLKEEVQAEALVRRLDVFARFLQAASFSQASQLNVGSIARELGIERKTTAGYFELLEDLLLGARVPVFTRRAKRAMTAHPKFYYFDAGVFRALRPKGPLDAVEEIDGAALETLVFQELRAANANHQLGYELFFWRTRDDHEVDFVLYGPRGLHAFEVKRSARVRSEDLAGLRLFAKDYPMAKLALLYGGKDRLEIDGISVLPFTWALPQLLDVLK